MLYQMTKSCLFRPLPGKLEASEKTLVERHACKTSQIWFLGDRRLKQSVSNHLVGDAMAPNADTLSAELERVQLISKAGEVPQCFLQSKPLISHTPESGWIPVIDLSGYFGSDAGARQDIQKQVARACLENGFFQVVNHGVELSVLEESMDVAKRFFVLPDEVKQKYAMPPRGTSRNWSGYGRFVQIGGSELEWQDSFLHYDPELHGPGGVEWPDQPPDYAEKQGKFKRQALELLTTLHEIACIDLGLPRTYLDENCTKSQVLKVNYYPACPRPDAVLGLNPHTDVSTFTILYQEEVAGLQMLHNEKWITVEPIPGALVINTGDILEILSNGRYKSVEHRAAVNAERERLSVAFGTGPSLEWTMGPSPELLGPDNPALYRSLIYNEFCQLRLTRKHDGKGYLYNELSIQKKP